MAGGSEWGRASPVKEVEGKAKEVREDSAVLLFHTLFPFLTSSIVHPHFASHRLKSIPNISCAGILHRLTI